MANLVSSPCTTSILRGCLAFAFLPHLTSIIDIYVLRALHRVRAQLPVRHLQQQGLAKKLKSVPAPPIVFIFAFVIFLAALCITYSNTAQERYRVLHLSLSLNRAID
jgi:hypothetical protein